MSKDKRKLIADSCQKFGLGFGLAAFVQADHPDRVVLFVPLSLAFLAAAVR